MFFIYISLKTEVLGEKALYIWVLWYVAHMGYVRSAYRIL